MAGRKEARAAGGAVPGEHDDSELQVDDTVDRASRANGGADAPFPPVEVYGRDPDAAPSAEHEAEVPRRFPLVRVGDLDIKPPEFIVRDLIEAEALALIFGDPECGKSFIAIDIACSVASGAAFHDHAVKAGPVIYIAGEGGNGLGRRFRAWEIARGLSLADSPLFVSRRSAALCESESVREIVDAVDEIAQTHSAPLAVIVDTVARNFGPGDENSTQDMAGFIQATDAMRTRYGSTVLLIHHTGHADKTRARGAMALKGALDAEFRVDRDEQGVVRMEATKMKDAEHPPPLAFRFAKVELGIQDDEGHEATSAVLTRTAYEPAAKRGKEGRGKWQTVALEQLQRLHREHRGRVEADGRDPDTARVSLETWRDACREAGMNRQGFHRAKTKLAEQEAVVIDRGFVWPA